MKQAAPAGKVLKFAAFEKAAGAIDVDAPLRFVASDESVDRYGDIVRQDGWDLAAFKRNPVALFGHAHDNIVGKYSRVWLEGKKLLSELMLAEAGTGAIVDYVRALVRQGMLKAVSVSFLPLEWEYRRDEKNDNIVGYEFTKQELLEISLVSVPANAEALAMAKGFKFSDDEVLRLLGPANRGANVANARAWLDIQKLRVRSS